MVRMAELPRALATGLGFSAAVALVLYLVWVRRKGYPLSAPSLALVFVLGALSALLALAVQFAIQPWLQSAFTHLVRIHSITKQVLTGPASPWDTAITFHAFNSESARFLSFCIEAGLVEEAVKCLAVLAVVLRQPRFDRPVYGIIYGTVAALGFEGMENAFEIIGQGHGMRKDWLLITHPLVSCPWAASIGWLKFRPGKWSVILVILGLLAAALAHGLIDFLVPYFGIEALDGGWRTTNVFLVGLMPGTSAHFLLFWVYLFCVRLLRGPATHSVGPDSERARGAQYPDSPASDSHESCEEHPPKATETTRGGSELK
jgi:RsiW-degrading membrane proteinase PrsW (M82 family)